MKRERELGSTPIVPSPDARYACPGLAPLRLTPRPPFRFTPKRIHDGLQECPAHDQFTSRRSLAPEAFVSIPRETR